MDPKNLGEPGVLAEHGDDGKACARGVLPGAVLQVAFNAQGDVVEHQGEQGFVGAPPGLEEGGDQAPDAAHHDAGQGHHQKQGGLGKGVSPVQGEVGGPDGPHHDLALRADVPELHLEGGGDGQGGTQQGDGHPDGDPPDGGSPQGAGEDLLVHCQGVVPQNQNEQGAHGQGQHNGPQADGPFLSPAQVLPLGQADQGLPLAVLMFCHGRPPPPFGSS